MPCLNNMVGVETEIVDRFTGSFRRVLDRDAARDATGGGSEAAKHTSPSAWIQSGEVDLFDYSRILLFGYRHRLTRHLPRALRMIDRQNARKYIALDPGNQHRFENERNKRRNSIVPKQTNGVARL